MKLLGIDQESMQWLIQKKEVTGHECYMDIDINYLDNRNGFDHLSEALMALSEAGLEFGNYDVDLHDLAAAERHDDCYILTIPITKAGETLTINLDDYRDRLK